jgi:hypothetical protein
MANTKITIKTGSIVEGDDFYGREQELQYAWECIRSERALLRTMWFNGCKKSK